MSVSQHPVSASAPPPGAPIRLAVVEDDAACRLALVHAVTAADGLVMVWTAASRAEALAQLRSQSPGAALDVLLVDLGLPDGSGLDVIAVSRRQWPQSVAMVSTIFGDEEHVLRAIQAGAMGYLLKDVPPAQVVEEIRLLAAGGSPISPMVARKLLMMRFGAEGSATPPPAGESVGDPDAENEIGLSARESEVLRLVARGHTLEEVARALSLSRHTVRTFVRRLYAKLQVSTRAQAVRKAQRQGLL